jgi:hypothetical protein
MLHACVERFDVMDGRGNILGWVGEVNKAIREFEISVRLQCRIISVESGSS